MPKVNWKKRNAGVLSWIPHPYHTHWQFTYSEDENSGSQAFLDNYDLKECPYKKRMKIVYGSVLLYIQACDTSVDVDLHLPSLVTMVIIKKYGKDGAFCFVTLAHGQSCSVKPGHDLQKNPHSKRC